MAFGPDLQPREHTLLDEDGLAATKRSRPYRTDYETS